MPRSVYSHRQEEAARDAGKNRRASISWQTWARARPLPLQLLISKRHSMRLISRQPVLWVSLRATVTSAQLLTRPRIMQHTSNKKGAVLAIIRILRSLCSLKLHRLLGQPSHSARLLQLLVASTKLLGRADPRLLFDPLLSPFPLFLDPAASQLSKLLNLLLLLLLHPLKSHNGMSHPQRMLKRHLRLPQKRIKLQGSLVDLCSLASHP